ncbi:ACP S-malonyltransferase [Propioniciclava coleopterorum]|uniref:[acyl-carrier-protein] S-malonyltransferase n=1 Tax=Propioniciclava coleopterorum TaxID=2714937 RepID=A0A6G7Y8V0_9ACTN|nr:ACP S-malonyltransferase [Propioniciclava coleopterorum]QIK73235.1 ACP S-malonyltransferase [Propioniciclava coleopterorum]
MLTIVAPGQGAQTPGFLAPWLEDADTAALLARLSEAAGLDLAHYGTDADAETIKDTAVAQPLLVAAGLIAADRLTGGDPVPFAGADVAAGHSVGEVTAAAGVGVLSPVDAMVLVRERAQGMAEASAARATTMAAVLRGEPEVVLAAIEAVGATAANNNGAGQIVAAGTAEQIAALKAAPPAGARVIPLAVAGAFHTEHMEPGRVRVAAAAAGLTAADPVVTILSNADGTAVAAGADYLARLVSQVTSPVRWDLCMATLADLGVTGILELPPAGTLTGIAKRNLSGVELFNLNTPDQLDDARAFVARHASATSQEA